MGSLKIQKILVTKILVTAHREIIIRNKSDEIPKHRMRNEVLRVHMMCLSLSSSLSSVDQIRLED